MYEKFYEHKKIFLTRNYRRYKKFISEEGKETCKPNNCDLILERPFAKFYNGHEVNVTAAELLLTKTRPTSFYKKHNLL